MFLTLAAQAGSFSSDFTVVASAGQLAQAGSSVDMGDESPFQQVSQPAPDTDTAQGSAPVQSGHRTPFIIMAAR